MGFEIKNSTGTILVSGSGWRDSQLEFRLDMGSRPKSIRKPDPASSFINFKDKNCPYGHAERFKVEMSSVSVSHEGSLFALFPVDWRVTTGIFTCKY